MRIKFAAELEDQSKGGTQDVINNTNNVVVTVPVLAASPTGRAPDPPASPIRATRSIDPPGGSPTLRSPEPIAHALVDTNRMSKSVLRVNTIDNKYKAD